MTLPPRKQSNDLPASVPLHEMLGLAAAPEGGGYIGRAGVRMGEESADRPSLHPREVAGHEQDALVPIILEGTCDGRARPRSPSRAAIQSKIGASGQMARQLPRPAERRCRYYEVRSEWRYSRDDPRNHGSAVDQGHELVSAESSRVAPGENDDG